MKPSRSLAMIVACVALLCSSCGAVRIVTLMNQSAEQLRGRKMDEAIQSATQARALAEEMFGTSNKLTGQVVMYLGTLHQIKNEYDEADRLYEQALEILIRESGPESLDVLNVMTLRAVMYFQKGDFSRSRDLYLPAITLSEKIRGPEHEETLATLTGLAKAYDLSGDHARAIELCQRVLEMKRRLLGEAHPSTALSMSNLASAYLAVGQYAEAEPLLLRALEIQQTSGEDDDDTADIIYGALASLYDATSRSSQAESLHRRTLALREKRYGRDHEQTATTMNNLGLTLLRAGKYADAKALLEESLRVEEKASGPMSANLAGSLSNLGYLYAQTGEYGNAASLYRRAISIAEERLGGESRMTSAMLSNLGDVYSRMREHARAIAVMEQALALSEKLYGVDHPRTAPSVSSLGIVHLLGGNVELAAPLLERAVVIYERSHIVDENTAQALSNLANLYFRRGDRPGAERLLRRALEIDEATLGADHPKTARSTSNLGFVALTNGEHARALALLQRALADQERVLGLKHPQTVESAVGVVQALLELGRTDALESAGGKLAEARREEMTEALSFASEAQRLAFAREFDPYFPAATLGDGVEVATAVLRFKGVVLDSILEDRQTGITGQDPKRSELLLELQSLRRQRLQLALSKTVGGEEQRERMLRRIDEIQSVLVEDKDLTRRALSVRPQDVADVLPAGTTLIEFLRYRHYEGRTQLEPRYGAVVISASAKPVWVSLGKAEELEREIARYQRALRNGTTDAELQKLLRGLYERIWRPVGAALSAGTRQVLLSPDGALSLLSFATLLDREQRFLGERFSLGYVASGRDLLREASTSISHRFVLFAAPDFVRETGAPPARQTASVESGVAPLVTGDGDSIERAREANRSAFQALKLDPLPGTRAESKGLQELAREWGWEVEVYEGAEATEDRLRALQSPGVLHLATHGFFLGAASDASEPRRGVGGIRPPAADLSDPPSWSLPALDGLSDPMYRSGIALAGAQSTLLQWRSGVIPATESDGVLLADEVVSLRLEGTWLVTVSACDSAIGEVRPGEGVLGIRRGFLQAGAQNLLMTLWPVSDRPTAELMQRFYVELDRGRVPPVEALARAQREILVRERKARGLASAVRVAGPFVLSSRQRPLAPREASVR